MPSASPQKRRKRKDRNPTPRNSQPCPFGTAKSWLKLGGLIESHYRGTIRDPLRHPSLACVISITLCGNAFPRLAFTDHYEVKPGEFRGTAIVDRDLQRPGLSSGDVSCRRGSSRSRIPGNNEIYPTVSADIVAASRVPIIPDQHLSRLAR